MPDRKPLVWFMTQAYRVRGGHEAHLLHFATELRRYGFQTRIMVLDALPREPHLFIGRLAERGIPLDTVRWDKGWLFAVIFALVAPLWAITMLRRKIRPQFRQLRSYVADRLSAMALKRAIRKERPDIIHVLGRLADYAYPILPVERSVFHHGTEGKMDTSWDEEELALFKTFVERAALNFAPGAGVAANIASEFGIKREIHPIYTICPDLSADRRAGSSRGRDDRGDGDGLRFGILCRMTEEKGIRHLLPALRDYRKKHNSVCFVFAGMGAMQQEIRNYLDTHDMLEIQLVSAFSSPVEILEQLDVFVHPSLSDAMPMAIAEALMCGLPCIVTNVGGIPDLVRDGREGLVIQSGSETEIVNAMERFTAMDSSEFAGFAQRARDRYEDVCCPERVGSVIAEHYREIMKATRS